MLKLRAHSKRPFHGIYYSKCVSIPTIQIFYDLYFICRICSLLMTWFYFFVFLSISQYLKSLACLCTCIDFPMFLCNNGTEPRACACWASALTLNYKHCAHYIILVGTEEERAYKATGEESRRRGKWRNRMQTQRICSSPSRNVRVRVKVCDYDPVW